MTVIRYHFVSLHQGTLQNSLISPPGQTVLIWYVVSFFFLEVKNCRSDNSCSCFSPHIVGLRDLLFFFFVLVSAASECHLGNPDQEAVLEVRRGAGRRDLRLRA